MGTRPEAIKLAPLAVALGARGLAPSIVLTGQHPGLDPCDFAFGRAAIQRLECIGQDDPHRHIRNVTEALLPMVASGPDLIVVQGDTSSALGAALAAFAANIPVAHVEAGLRTHDPECPWPEEEYRTAIDRQAELLFAPTAGAAANLRHEAVEGEIHVVGNTSIDALLAVEGSLPPLRKEAGGQRLLVTCHRRESWGEGLRSIAQAVAEIAASGAQCRFVLHPNPAVAQSMREMLGGRAGIELVQPCSHRELVQQLREADLVLSDSGGIQEEAPALGVPLLVLREKTERPEGIQAGTAVLVGTNADRIVAEARRLLGSPDELARMSRRLFPYGDGKSAPRIAKIIGDWLGKKIRAAVGNAGTSPAAARRQA